MSIRFNRVNPATGRTESTAVDNPAKPESDSASPSDRFDKALASLHRAVGVCGHCGARSCAGRAGHSVLPQRIVIGSDELLAILRISAGESS